MKYLLNAKQMKQVDVASINGCHIPSLCLMERAALSVTEELLKIDGIKGKKVDVVAGFGNNGADGLAIARQLNEAGIRVRVGLTGSRERRGTEESDQQRAMLTALNIPVRYLSEDTVDADADIIVDAIFGIGLTRPVTGVYERLIQEINAAKEAGSYVVSVDMPSGVDSDDGQILGVAVNADKTVTFGYEKIGLIMEPGRICAGEVVLKNPGFAPEEFLNLQDAVYTYTEADLLKIPKRPAGANKGTFGKVLLAAGSEDMGGAACLSAESTYRSGCGYVKVLTHRDNRTAVLTHVPEAVLITYETAETIENKVAEAISSNENGKKISLVDAAVLGPGLSVSENGRAVVRAVLNSTMVPTVVDADALNIIAEEVVNGGNPFAGKENTEWILTPHMGEMSRLTGIPVLELKKNPIQAAVRLSRALKVIVVLKDARTVVTDGDEVFINTSGNDGMATAGSGDVLTGVISALLARGMSPFEAAKMGVFVHGLAGDRSVLKVGKSGLCAGDIVKGLSLVLE